MSKILLNTGPSERGWHRVETAARCMQLFAYNYILEIGHGDRGPLVRGSIGHVGLAHHFARRRAQQQKTDPDVYYEPEEAMRLVAATFGELGEQYLPIATHAVLAYMNAYAGEQFEIVMVEEKVSGMIRWPEHLRVGARANVAYPITQRFDRVYKNTAGRFWIEDHKFVSTIKSSTAARYTLSGQFQLMQWFGRAIYGDSFGGARINLVQCSEKPKSVQVSLDAAPRMLNRFPQVVCDIEERIEALRAEGRDPWEYPAQANEHVCMTAYGRCPAFDICRWGKSGI
jgi:PD-(D/E)XK nuclease superfamily